MELRQLEYFVAVTEESSFTKAAARLNVAQPGVSAQLRQLERELVQRVVNRGHVAVGAVSGCGALGLPDLLASFHDAHPGVQISLREGNSDRLVDDVRAGKLDLALVAAAGAPAPAPDSYTHL